MKKNYNDIYCKCPKCCKNGHMRIEPIGKGYRKFNLNKRETYEKLSFDKINELRKSIKRKRWFKCPSCNNKFYPFITLFQLIRRQI